MGLFDRLRGRADGTPPDAPVVGSPDPHGATAFDPADHGADDEGTEEVGIRAPTPAEEDTLAAVRARYGHHGIEPADLTTLEAAYDDALARADSDGPGDVVEVVSIALGDHLVSTAGYRWVVSTDPFGTDLAVAPPRRGMPVVTRTLVAVRWMGRESGWLHDVAQHLARAGRG